MPALLVIDDDPAVLLVLRRAFHGTDIALTTATSAAEGLAAVTRSRPDVVLLDIRLPDGSGLDLFEEIRRLDARLPVIFITASGTSNTAIGAMKLGALDYLQKPLDLPAVRELLKRAFALHRLTHVPVAIDGTEEADGEADLLIGRCAAMQAVYKAIGRVAGQDVTVLIRGESGTGKELVARAIYQHSRRADQTFLAINCAAIPEALLESELFGHEKGAFTGADRQRIGKFEQCHGGTLFLDEIGDMPALLQTKILRLLQERRFERVGGGETIHADVRIIAATHQDLEELMAQRRFRADLYYRLKVCTIELPPLRERADDLPLLVEHLLRRFRRELNRPAERLAPEALAALRGYPWPGNVRELEGVLKEALLRSVANVLVREDLPDGLTSGVPATPGTAPASPPDLAGFLRDRLQAGSQCLHAEMLAWMEEFLIREVLRHTDGNQVHAARTLGISRNHLRKKLTQYRILISRTVASADAGPAGP